MKIVVLDGYTENPGDLSWDKLGELGELTVYEHTETEKIAQRMQGAQIILTNKTPIDRDTLELCPEVRYIGVLATGYNVIDIDAAKEKGVVVCNIPTYGTDAVAQHVFALLLELCQRTGHHAAAVKEGRWARCRDFCFWDYPLVELSGKTMGFIGFGRIGQRTAQIAKAFGMDVLAYDMFPNETGKELGRYVDLDELLACSDVVSLHCPLFPETKEIISHKTISKMKHGALLINTSRGPLINEMDLAKALHDGRLVGAGLDVLSQEPPQADHPLLSAPNCIVTPHIAWATKESRQRLMDIAVENVKNYLAGQPSNCV